MEITPEQLISRFFLDTDTKVEHLLYPLPDSWWSRPYEYGWCASFTSSEATVLDAASGIAHPFKFYLAEHCRHVCACDSDPRIESIDAMIEDARSQIGEAAAAVIGSNRTKYKLIDFRQANITRLPYDSSIFHRIFCISVLEHLSPADATLALKEFQRTLNDEGLLLLTFDYPTVNLQLLDQQIKDAGLEYCSTMDYTLPARALHTLMWGGLYCFRAALKKKS